MSGWQIASVGVALGFSAVSCSLCVWLLRQTQSGTGLRPRRGGSTTHTASPSMSQGTAPLQATSTECSTDGQQRGEVVKLALIHVLSKPTVPGSSGGGSGGHPGTVVQGQLGSADSEP